MRLFALALSILAFLALAACGGNQTSSAPAQVSIRTVTETVAPNETVTQSELIEEPPPESAPSIDDPLLYLPCSVTKYDSSVIVTVSGYSSPQYCDEIVRQWSGDFEFWSRGYEQSEAYDALSGDRLVRATTCSLYYDNEEALQTRLTISDAGEPLDNGVSYCGRLIASGWREIANSEPINVWNERKAISIGRVILPFAAVDITVRYPGDVDLYEPWIVEYEGSDISNGRAIRLVTIVEINPRTGDITAADTEIRTPQ